MVTLPKPFVKRRVSHMGASAVIEVFGSPEDPRWEVTVDSKTWEHEGRLGFNDGRERLKSFLNDLDKPGLTWAVVIEARVIDNWGPFQPRSF